MEGASWMKVGRFSQNGAGGGLLGTPRDTEGLCGGCIGRLEKQMETTISGLGLKG